MLSPGFDRIVIGGATSFLEPGLLLDVRVFTVGFFTLSCSVYPRSFIAYSGDSFADS